MGRRPLPRPQVDINPQSPEIQDKIDSISKKILDKVDSLIDGKIGELDALDLKGLMSEFRKTVMAIKKPASSLQMVQIPAAPQRSVDTVARAQNRIADAADTERIKMMRQSQRKFLDAQDAQ